MLRLIVCFIILFASMAGTARSESVTLFAASSTSGALEELKPVYERKTGHSLRLAFASSATLARQIIQGAPADIFLSANTKWADVLETEALVAANGWSELWSNRLVLAAPSGSKISESQDPKAIISSLPVDGRIAMGDPNHVPAGIYGKTALERLGLWQSLEGRIAPTANVRVALALVERGEAPIGLVYASDAATSSKVKTIYVFPPEVTPHISYPLVIVKGGNQEAARRLRTFLSSADARKVFKRHGFITPQ